MEASLREMWSNRDKKTYIRIGTEGQPEDFTLRSADDTNNIWDPLTKPSLLRGELKDRLGTYPSAQVLLDLGQEMLDQATGTGEEADNKYIEAWQLKIMAGGMAAGLKTEKTAVTSILHLARDAERATTEGSLVRKKLHVLTEYLTRIAIEKGIKRVKPASAQAPQTSGASKRQKV
ncbi:hypothetical protein H0H93_008301 [Arthromyces matolae]|nr:hypothetical protein H0H93_008301 [Arthromyces matolae]